MRYFKVTDEHMRSVYYKYYFGRGVQYQLNEFVKAEYGELFAYDSTNIRIYGFPEYDLDESTHKNRRIFECECIAPIVTTVHIFSPNILKSVEEVGQLTPNSSRGYNVVRSVVLAKAIKLTRELSRKDVMKLCEGEYYGSQSMES